MKLCHSGLFEVQVSCRDRTLQPKKNPSIEPALLAAPAQSNANPVFQYLQSHNVHFGWHPVAAVIQRADHFVAVFSGSVFIEKDEIIITSASGSVQYQKS